MATNPNPVTGLPLSGGTVSGNVTVTGSIPAGGLAGPLQELVQTTTAAGVALANGTPTILTWTAPADGKLHRVTFYSWLNVTTTETGGQVNATYTGPTGATITAQLFAAGLTGPGVFLGSALAPLVGSGQTVTIAQGTALTAGAATVYAEIWAS